MSLLTIAGVGLFLLGAAIACVNFYLSFLRYSFYRLRGGSENTYRWVSGIPLFGSLLLWASIPLMVSLPGMVLAAVAISLIDTGGPHWLAGVLLAEWWRADRKHGEPDRGTSQDRQ